MGNGCSPSAKISFTLSSESKGSSSSLGGVCVYKWCGMRIWCIALCSLPCYDGGEFQAGVSNCLEAGNSKSVIIACSKQCDNTCILPKLPVSASRPVGNPFPFKSCIGGKLGGDSGPYFQIN